MTTDYMELIEQGKDTLYEMIDLEKSYCYALRYGTDDVLPFFGEYIRNQVLFSSKKTDNMGAIAMDITNNRSIKFPVSLMDIKVNVNIMSDMNPSPSKFFFADRKKYIIDEEFINVNIIDQTDYDIKYAIGKNFKDLYVNHFYGLDIVKLMSLYIALEHIVEKQNMSGQWKQGFSLKAAGNYISGCRLSDCSISIQTHEDDNGYGETTLKMLRMLQNQ